MSGTLFGIGVGPGDPDLLTVKAVKTIAACPVLAYPAPETGESLARRIAAPFSDDTLRIDGVVAPHDEHGGRLRGGLVTLHRISAGGVTLVISTLVVS